MALINPAQVEWHGKEVQALSQAVLDDIYSNPDLNAIHTIMEGIVALEQIIFLGFLEKITKADAGCGTGETSPTIEMREKFWTPAKVKIWISDCSDNFEESFWIWGLKKGINRNDLTNTDLAEFVMSRMSSAMLEDVLRIVWFNDTDAANVSDTSTGLITDGVSVTDYNIIDGLWKQIFAAVATDSTRRVPISENGEASYSAQNFAAADTTALKVTGILQDVFDNADPRLRARLGTGLQFIVTESIYNQYKKELKSAAGGGVNEAWFMIQNGKKLLTFDGVPLVPMNFWDRTIRADFDNGDTYHLPHRILLTVKENIPVGFDDSGAVSGMQQYYDPQTEKTNWKSKYRIDTKLLKEYMFQVAY